jgi:hypothetical protein
MGLEHVLNVVRVPDNHRGLPSRSQLDDVPIAVDRVFQIGKGGAQKFGDVSQKPASGWSWRMSLDS